jgi:hypothetical protein
MSLVQADVEISRLARLLGTGADELGYLRQVQWQDIRDLREQVTLVMFEADRQMLQRVASATRLLPSKLTATVGERAFGPLLSARVTGLLEPSRAVDIADRLPTTFLADLAEQLDPRRASRRSRAGATPPARRDGRLRRPPVRGRAEGGARRRRRRDAAANGLRRRVQGQP